MPLKCVKRGRSPSAASVNQSSGAGEALLTCWTWSRRPVAAARGETAGNHEQGRRAAARPHLGAGDIIVAMPAPVSRLGNITACAKEILFMRLGLSTLGCSGRVDDPDRRSCAAQAPATKPSAKTRRRTYAPVKTPWGDPDLQGVYTNKDESGIPVRTAGPVRRARPSTTSTMPSCAELVQSARNRRRSSVRAGIGGADTGAGPMHWYEHYDAKNSRPWLVIDPADGMIPPMTPEANARNAERARRAAAGRGPADCPEDRSLYDRCITRGLPGSMMPAIYGNSYQILQAPGWVAIRYEMIHETRVIPLDGRPHVGIGRPQLHGRCARPLRRQHAGRRDDELQGADPRTAAPARAAQADRALHADGAEDASSGR